MSKKEMVKIHLKHGGSITGLEAIDMFGLYRLSSVINRLRNNGMDIKTTMVTTPDNVIYAKYHL